MGDQPEVPNFNEGVEDDANPNAVNINAEDFPLNNQNMAQGGQLSSIALFSCTKGLEALTYAKAIDGSTAAQQHNLAGLKLRQLKPPQAVEVTRLQTGLEENELQE